MPEALAQVTEFNKVLRGREDSTRTHGPRESLSARIRLVEQKVDGATDPVPEALALILRHVAALVTILEKAVSS